MLWRDQIVHNQVIVSLASFVDITRLSLSSEYRPPKDQPLLRLFDESFEAHGSRYPYSVTYAIYIRLHTLAIMKVTNYEVKG